MKFFLSSFTIINSWFLLLLIFLRETRVVQSLPIRQHLKLLGEEKPDEWKTCDFSGEQKEHSVADLLRCTDVLAENSLPPKSRKSSTQLDTVFENFQKSFSQSSGRQGYGFPYEERPGVPFYRPGRPILDQLAAGFYGNEGFPEYPGPYEPQGGFTSGLIGALDSISQYDDLKCVPRLLCEIATGSRPGSGEYKASNLEDFGKNTLIGLLSAYNFEEASPVLAFGKAALLGYTSKGDSSVCYEEYVTCPRDPRDLVHYLNNHNGGFFRFFKNARGNPVSQGSNRSGFAVKAPAPPPGLSGPESDRTGTGELKFDTPEPSARYDGQKSAFRLSDEDFSKVVFPDDEKRDGQGNRAPKSLQLSSSPGFFPVSSNENFENIKAPFFPSNYEDLEESNVVFASGEGLRDESYESYFKKGRLLVPDQETEETSVFRFPGPEERGNLDSGLSRLFPLN